MPRHHQANHAVGAKSRLRRTASHHLRYRASLSSAPTAGSNSAAPASLSSSSGLEDDDDKIDDDDDDEKTSSSVQSPAPTPAASAAPIAVVSTFPGRDTRKPSTSACVCINKPPRSICARN